MEGQQTYTAFAGVKRIATGDVRTMLLATKQCLDGGEAEQVLIFEDETGRQIDFDFRGTPNDVLTRLSDHPCFKNAASGELVKARTGPGRPKLGVVCREISLLPRHWEWLEQQPEGISGSLRRLVDEARKRGRPREAARTARDAASRFMWIMAGNLPGFEEASRALFARDESRLRELIQGWPCDIRGHLERLVGRFLRLESEAEQATRAQGQGTEPQS
jgi:uncharacterized protein